jgi:hypothetical protein
MQADQALHDLTAAGIENRYPVAERREIAKTAAARELAIIQKAGMSAHYLLAFECRNVASTMDIPTTPGWDDTCVSMVCYALGISDLNPLVFNLDDSQYLHRVSWKQWLLCLTLPICAVSDDDEYETALAKHFEKPGFQAVFESDTAFVQHDYSADDEVMRHRENKKSPLKFVRLRDLSIQRNTLRLLAEQGVNVSLSAIPFEDAKTFSTLGRKNNEDQSFLCRRGMRHVLETMTPTDIPTLTVAVARYLFNISRRYYVLKTLVKVEPDHPFSACVVSDMSCVNDWGDASLTTFDQRCASVTTLGQLQVAIDQLSDEQIRESFSMPQALSMAIIAYRTAYLKAHYPAQYAQCQPTPEYFFAERNY